MGVLDGIVGTIDSGSEYDLQAYQNYLANLMSKVINSQYNIEIMAKEITSTVMVEGKWYDDCAAAFARWWNDDGGEKDGIDYLNGLSTILENLVKITAVQVCTDMRNSTTMRASYSAYSLINDFANGNPYIHGIRNMTKSDLGQIGETVCRAGVKNSANGEQINSMVARVSECADTIKSNIKEICNSIQEDLIEGRALKIKGLDSSILEDRKRDMLFRVNTIVEQLSNELKNSKLKISRDEAVMKSTLDGSDASSAINAAAAATVAGTVSAATMTAEDMAADAKARENSGSYTREIKTNRFSRPGSTSDFVAQRGTINSNSQTINGGSASKGTLNSNTLNSAFQNSSTSSSKSTGTVTERFAETKNSGGNIRNSNINRTIINGGNTNSSSMNTLNSVEKKASQNYLKSEVVKANSNGTSSSSNGTAGKGNNNGSSNNNGSGNNKNSNNNKSSGNGNSASYADNYAKGSANAARQATSASVAKQEKYSANATKQSTYAQNYAKGSAAAAKQTTSSGSQKTSSSSSNKNSVSGYTAKKVASSNTTKSDPFMKATSSKKKK